MEINFTWFYVGELDGSTSLCWINGDVAMYLPDDELLCFDNFVNNGQGIDYLLNTMLERSIDYSFYFENLDSNFPVNNGTSCGYVSTASLLAYYDIFVSDEIISNGGIGLSGSFFESAEVYNSFNVEDCLSSPGVNNNFQSFLISNLGNNQQGSLTEIQISNMISNYLSLYTSISSSQYTVKTFFSTNSSINEDNIKNEIDNGRPVILLATDYEYSNDIKWGLGLDSGHAMISYGYKEVSGGMTLFKCHMGWSSDCCDVYLRNISNFYGISIEFLNVNHACNEEAYIYKHDETCDGFGLCHLYNDFSHYLSFESLNTTYHKCKCPTCNENLFNMTHVFEDHHCIKCNRYTSSHDYTQSYIWYNYTKHKATCSCGSFQLQNHYVSGNSISAGQRYGICLLCGGSVDIGFVVPTSVGEYLNNTSTKCSVLPNGVVIVYFEGIKDYYQFVSSILYFDDDDNCF